jgi:hypothetical protein
MTTSRTSFRSSVGASLRSSLYGPLFATALLAACRADSAAPTPEPEQVAEELLAADRSFAANAGETDLVSALTAMFDSSVIMPIAGGTFASGLPEAHGALTADSTNASARAEWWPVRAGISADGAHGFTFGYMDVHRADSALVPLKYLAYWVRRDAGWRVAAYKRGLRAGGAADTTPMAPALPAALTSVSTDSAALAAHTSSLRAAEQAFSDEAQVIGLGAAFAGHGSADAVNMGGPDTAVWIVGAEAIGQAVGGGADGPSPVSWSADRVLVASSGDLGVTFGLIVPNASVAGDGPAGFPFFTIWRRSGPDEPWRYVAE